MKLRREVRTPGKPKEILTGVVTLGANGAVASQDCEGFTVAQTASEDGRFTITLAEPYTSIEYCHGVLEITADAAPVQAKGLVACLRGVSASGQVAYLQFVITPTAAAAGADADAQDSAVLRIMIVAKKGRLG